MARPTKFYYIHRAEDALSQALQREMSKEESAALDTALEARIFWGMDFAYELQLRIVNALKNAGSEIKPETEHPVQTYVKAYDTLMRSTQTPAPQ